MGVNNLIDVSGGNTVLANHINNINDAISQDVVPRSSSGVPTTEVADLGTASLFWSQVFARILQLRSTISIESTDTPDTMQFKVDSAISAELIANGFKPSSFGPREKGTNATDPGEMQMASSELISFTSSSANEDVTNSDTILTSKGGAALIGFYGVFDDATGGGIYGSAGGERFKIKNSTASVDLTGPMFVQTSTTQIPIGAYVQLVQDIGGTVGSPQTLLAEAIDSGVSISGVRMFALEI
jgi:hypothetical protein